ncbi:nudix hydrolase 20, chloroplastic-like [Melia azedarach]|uniref:Nudix hydrolase 20, chloroplastic-like n=1 Tax=Melia azedarach TaxID=155640 RepID=A0ACC1XAR2_MELAZ|nr:nudix hydrolase 20, chloroplastic-like [Melia azedarach]
MASNAHHIPQRIRFSLASLYNCKASHASAKTSITTFPVRLLPTARSVSAASMSYSTCSSTFTWDDVVRVSQPEYSPDDSSDLHGYFEKIKNCNRGSELQSEFLPFIIEGRVVGYIHNGFASHLRRYDDVFVFSEKNGGRFGSHVTLNSKLRTAEERTKAVGEIVKCLGEEELIPGIRNELYPVSSSFDAPIFFSLERAAAPYFGIKVYGVQMNGYVEKGGQKFLWIGKRSQVKPTYPGMLDQLVAGGLPRDITCGENLIKECEEEAGIPRPVSSGALPVGAVSYMDIDGFSYKRDVLFCYDLKLPEDFVPKNQDGEVEGFQLIPVTHVANVIRRTEFFKPNCSLVIIDFLFRHGYICPEYFGYLDLLQSLRSGDCS